MRTRDIATWQVNQTCNRGRWSPGCVPKPAQAHLQSGRTVPANIPPFLPGWLPHPEGGIIAGQPTWRNMCKTFDQESWVDI